MATGISFASVCLRKLERLKLLLSVQRSAFESDLLVDEGHVEFLETISTKLQQTTSLKNLSYRNTVFSTKRLSTLSGAKFSTSQERLLENVASSRDMKLIKTRKSHHMSFGGVASNPRIQGSIKLDLKQPPERPTLATSFYRQMYQKHQHPSVSHDDLVHANFEAENFTPGSATNFHGLTKPDKRRSILTNRASDIGSPNLFSSIKKSVKTSKKVAVEEGCKTDRYPTTFQLETINESPIRHASTMSNPSLQSLYATEAFVDGKVPKSPPSQITHFEIKNSEASQKPQKLVRLNIPKEVEKIEPKKSPRKYLTTLRQ